MEKKKSGLFSKIQNLDDAQKMTKDTAYGFYALAALQAVIGFLFAPSVIIDAVLLLVLAFFLHKFKSRIASVLLLAFSGFTLISTFQNKFFGGQEGGKNLMLALIVAVIAARAVEASFKYHKYKITTSSS